MAISPFHQSNLLPLLTVALRVDTISTSYFGTTDIDRTSGGLPGIAFDCTGLTGNSFSLKLYDTVARSVSTGAGTFAILGSPTQGIVQYSWANPDTQTVGTYQVLITATVAGKPLGFDAIDFSIIP